MSPDDHRHGTRAGYIAGCRHDCCRVPHLRYQKRSKLRALEQGTQIISSHRVLARALWWQARGVSVNALCSASHAGYGTLDDLMTGQRAVCLRSTDRAILAVTWDHLPDRGLCYADLTRARVNSLMAAGHPLAWIAAQAGPGLPIGGRWRQQERVTIGTARRIQHVYDRAPLSGGSAITQTKARNRGHRHPLAWDDPGVPAMPRGWSPATDETAGAA